MQAIVAKVVEQRETQVTPRTRTLKQSSSMGQVESTIRWWRAKLKTLRYGMEMQHGAKLTPNHVLWPHLVEAASWITARFRVRLDGQTSYFGVYGTAYRGEVIPFGETCLVKVPTSSSRGLRGGRRQHKGDTSFVYGIWIGKHDSNDDHRVLTRHGEVRARTVRRLPEDRRADKELLDAICGAPWSEPVKSVPRQAKMDATPTPVPTATLAETTEAMLETLPVMPTDQPQERAVVAVDAAADAASPVAPQTVSSSDAPMDSTVVRQPPSEPEGEPSAKRLKEDFVGAIETDQTLNDPLDYSELMNVDELGFFNKTAYDAKDVVARKIEGLKILDEHGVRRVVPRGAAHR